MFRLERMPSSWITFHFIQLLKVIVEPSKQLRRIWRCKNNQMIFSVYTVASFNKPMHSLMPSFSPYYIYQSPHSIFIISITVLQQISHHEPSGFLLSVFTMYPMIFLVPPVSNFVHHVPFIFGFLHFLTFELFLGLEFHIFFFHHLCL